MAAARINAIGPHDGLHARRMTGSHGLTMNWNVRGTDIFSTRFLTRQALFSERTWCLLLFDAEFAHLLTEKSSVNAEQFGGLAFVPLGLSKSTLDQ
jgi:hypothetical protein